MDKSMKASVTTRTAPFPDPHIAMTRPTGWWRSSSDWMTAPSARRCLATMISDAWFKRSPLMVTVPNVKPRLGTMTMPAGRPRSSLYRSLGERTACSTAYGIEGTEQSYFAEGVATITTLFDDREHPSEALLHDSGGRLILQVTFTTDNAGR